MTKKIRKSVSIVVIFIFTLVLTSCSFFDNLFNRELDPSTFDEFTKNLLVSLVGGDELTCNYFFEDRTAYGLEDYEPSLPTPQVTSVVNLAAINMVFGQIKNYDYEKLNDDQKMTYNLIVDLVDNINAQTSEMSYLDNNYLGTYLGYQAQLPLLLTEYHFRNTKDIENYLKYLSLVPNTFKEYYDFEVEKADKGYGMPFFVIENVIEQCNAFIEGIENESSFMFSVIEDKINSCTFLNDAEKLSYIEQNKTLLKTTVKEGYQFVADNLSNIKGKGTNNEGLAHYKTNDGEEIGKQYYQILFQDTVGYDITCDEAINYVDDKIMTYLAELYEVSTKISTNTTLTNQLESILSNETFLMTNTPENQLELYKTLVKNDFPELPIEPSIVVKYIDKSMQNNFSPAAYMTSPIDNITEETIYLNPADIYLFDDLGNQTSTLDYNYLYNTLAHEGLPGHLYQTAYFKSLDVNPIRKILKNSGYVEGWATYAENYSYNFLRETYNEAIIDYLITNAKLTAAIYSRIDLGIHYEGWSIYDTYEFMNDYFAIESSSDITAAYRQLVEIPTNYQEYFFTYMKFNDMYAIVSRNEGSVFDAREFHKTILDCGPAPLKYVEKVVYDKYGIK